MSSYTGRRCSSSLFPFWSPCGWVFWCCCPVSTLLRSAETRGPWGTRPAQRAQASAQPAPSVPRRIGSNSAPRGPFSNSVGTAVSTRPPLQTVVLHPSPIAIAHRHRPSGPPVPSSPVRLLPTEPPSKYRSCTPKDKNGDRLDKERARRARQDKAGQGRAKQDKAGQGGAGLAGERGMIYSHLGRTGLAC